MERQSRTSPLLGAYTMTTRDIEYFVDDVLVMRFSITVRQTGTEALPDGRFIKAAEDRLEAARFPFQTLRNAFFVARS